MRDEDAAVAFEVSPLKVGHEWQVVASWPSGHVEYITGFVDEIEALRWIGSEHQLDWLKARTNQK